jgi:hypothetical protein
MFVSERYFVMIFAQIRPDFFERIEHLWYNQWMFVAVVLPVVVVVIVGVFFRVWIRGFLLALVLCWYTFSRACWYVATEMHRIPISEDEMNAIGADTGLSTAAFGFAPICAISYCVVLFGVGFLVTTLRTACRTGASIDLLR